MLEKVALASLLTHKLSRSRLAETLLCTGVRLHFWHFIFLNAVVKQLSVLAFGRAENGSCQLVFR